MRLSTRRSRRSPSKSRCLSLAAACGAALVGPASQTVQAAEYDARQEPAPTQTSSTTTREAALPWTQAPGSVLASFNLGLGPNVLLDQRTVFPTGRIALDGMYRLQRADAGPAVGLMAHMLFRGGYFGLQLGPIASWDLYLAEVKGIRIYVGPIVGTGYNLTAVDTVAGSFTAHAWFLHLGGQARAMFNKTWGAFVRPVSFDVIANDTGAYGHWSLSIGVSYDL